MPIARRFALVVALHFGAAISLSGQPPANSGEWKALFDGESLGKWKPTPFDGRGEVRVSKGIILLGNGRNTGITWTGYFPRSDYEIRFEAARLEGKDFFAAITFPVGSSYCSWINGGWDGTVVGLSNLDGYDASENETSTVHDFIQGHWYAFRLAVTERRIQAWIDDRVIVDVDMTGRQLGLPFGEEDLSTPLGFASYRTVAGLRKIEYRRLH
jgi:hypothetical protein